MVVWEDFDEDLNRMKMAFIVLGIIVVLVIAVFLYFLISGADESRRWKLKSDEEAEDKGQNSGSI